MAAPLNFRILITPPFSFRKVRRRRKEMFCLLSAGVGLVWVQPWWKGGERKGGRFSSVYANVGWIRRYPKPPFIDHCGHGGGEWL